jgi:AcrR family transcriptional regulator
MKSAPSPSSAPHAARNRVRNAEQTRARLLAAAIRLFAARGYGQVGLREIAAAAHVTVGLINRYFGTKENLFREVVAASLDNDYFFAVPRSEAGEFLARYVVGGADAAMGDRQRVSVLMLLRSAGAEPAASILREQLTSIFIVAISRWLEGRDAEIRAGLICSYLFGLTILRSVIGLDSLNKADPDELVACIAPTLQALIDFRG